MPQHTQLTHNETICPMHFHARKMVDQNQEAEHIRDQEQSRNTKGKYHFQINPTKEDEEITRKDIEEAKNNKEFMKIMKVLL